MFKTIVVSVDGTQPSVHAVELASGLARQSGARLVLFHAVGREVAPVHLRKVAEERGFLEEMGDDLENVNVIATGAMVPGAAAVTQVPTETLEKFGTAVLRDASAAAAKAGATQVETRMVDEPAIEAILACAQAESADLIVTGSRGVGDLHSLILGSFSHELLKKAECPCLIVK